MVEMKDGKSTSNIESHIHEGETLPFLYVSENVANKHLKLKIKVSIGIIFVLAYA